MELYFDTIECSLGKIYVVVNEESEVVAIELFEEGFDKLCLNNTLHRCPEKCSEVSRQLYEYFEGKRKNFELNLHLNGTEFQKKVWKALLEIPYGQVRSYSDIASAIGSPKAVRAVGGANRVNKIPVIIPCHRVIGKDKSMVGYAGSNIDKKEILLKLEGVDF